MSMWFVKGELKIGYMSRRRTAWMRERAAGLEGEGRGGMLTRRCSYLTVSQKPFVYRACAAEPVPNSTQVEFLLSLERKSQLPGAGFVNDLQWFER